MEQIKAFFAWVSANALSIKRFVLISGSIAGVALFVAVGVTVVLLASDGRDRIPPIDFTTPTLNEHPDNNNDLIMALDPQQTDNDDGGLLRPPARTNFLLVGLDDENRLADAIMVGTFYRDSGNIHMMSVPRDMFVQLPPHRIEQMNAAGVRPPSRMKITELRPHGGRELGIYFFKDQLEEMFGINFHFFVEIELAAFRRVVDAIGGVYMDIPRRLHYRNPYARVPFVIDVPAGENVRLDGAMAEGVVRYRNWPMGDLQRNQMQMQFMTNLMRQMLTREAIMNDPIEMISIILTEVRSNITGMDALRYIPSIRNISSEGIHTFTMPGNVGMVGGREFWLPNSAQLPEVISQVFHAIPEIEDIDEDA